MHATRTLATVFFAAANAAGSVDSDADAGGPNSTSNVLTRDVTIIGGGVTGSYAATWLHDRGYSFAVVEKQSNLGGHTQTYTDPASGVAIEYGNVFFQDTPRMRDYMQRYNISFSQIPPINDPSHAIKYYDFKSGQEVGFEPPPGQAVQDGLDRWAKLVETNFSYLDRGYYLPDQVPDELMISFADFVNMHSLGDIVNTAFQIGQGYGDFMRVPTLYAAKILSPALVRQSKQKSMLITPDNGLLYRRSEAEFSQSGSLFLSSTVSRLDRSLDQDGYMSVWVETAVGGGDATARRATKIRTRKLLVTIPPPSALEPGFGPSAAEQSLFSRFSCNHYWAGVVRGAQLPRLEMQNCDRSNQAAVPTMPGIYVFEATPAPDLHTFWYGAQAAVEKQTQTPAGVRAEVLATIQRLRGAAGSPAATGQGGVEFVAVADYSPFACMVDGAAIGQGFYRRLYALQGVGNVWWTGAAWHTHDASLLLEFTSDVLANMTGVKNG
ncbi:hypothetical protein MCOR27_004595 [Pyricularia oryzae]|uniref:Amine oxidase domain-containing protein n=1 Tax=Pyricularia grisea TaxID=148305 RepID=A0ABQ8ND16_PYRGI|nr:hypothetical protein MCOR01_007904 [Pyricularia oryzae]KAI6295071.1 hypothetical protein MCOR33_007959 [Pyricularia grisea]KAH9433436.1 hypothetical protein MCOR02_005483 [Pyricularia oryzae]KAI6280671.1 hypothetical protein MCOR27_004595 [Pyricularia oryzae]KAI6313257.1 hypothetical protein MCOR34_005308 [Pyricularia oryzae]